MAIMRWMNAGEAKKVVIYARVSRDAHQRSKSCEQQISELQRWANKEGWDVAEVFQETGSASKFAKKERSEWIKVLQRLDEGDIYALLTWESSRATRTFKELVVFQEVCEKHGILWGYGGKLHRFDDDSDNLLTQVQMAVNESEVRRTSSRIKRHMVDSAKRGRPHGKQLWGYRRIYDEVTRELVDIVPDEATAPLVRELFMRVKRRDSLHSIAKDFNERGVPSRRPLRNPHREGVGWITQSVKQVVKNPAYAGLRVHNGEVVGRAIWPPLVSQDDFDAVQAILNDPARDTRRGAENRITNMLTNIAECGVCGAPLGSARQPRHIPKGKTAEDIGGKYYKTYTCKGRGNGEYRPGSRFHVSMQARFMDMLISKAVVGRLSQEDFLANVSSDDASVNARRVEVRAEIDKIKAYLDDVKAEAARRMDLSIYYDQADRLEPRLKELEEEIKKLSGMPRDVVELASATDIEQRWEELEIEKKRDVIRALMTIRLKPIQKNEKAKLDPHRVEVIWK